MRGRRFRCAGLLAVLLPALAAPVAGYAQVDSREGIALQNQVYELRQEIQGLRSDLARGDNGSGGGGGGGGGDIAAQLLSRVQAMEEEVRQLRGRIDETQNLATRQNADLSKRIDDLTFQLNMGKGGASGPAPPPVQRPAADASPRPDVLPRIVMPGPSVGGPSPQSFTFNQSPVPMREARQPPAPPTARTEPIRPVPKPDSPALADAESPSPYGTESSGKEPLVGPDGKRTPEMALQEGHAALARRDYATAERAAREVMNNRTSPRAYDGQFLLAQTLSGEKQYAQAAIAFDDAYNRSHKGRHAEDALVGLAGALTAINEKRAACDTLNRLRVEFPQVRADVQETIAKTNERAGCGK